MKLLKMEKPQCLLYSAAMVLDVEVERLIDYIGHSGLENIVTDSGTWVRGISIQEIVDFALLEMNRAIVTINVFPVLGKQGIWYYPIYSDELAEHRFRSYLREHDAILMEENHAVAWNSETQQVYDPRGVIGPIRRIYRYQIAHLVLPCHC